MKTIVLLLACMLLVNLLEAQNIQGTWKMNAASKRFEGDRDLWLVINTDSDSVYSGHSVTVSYTSFGAKPDTVVAEIRGYSDKKSNTIYLEENKVIHSMRTFTGGLENFRLTYISRKRGKFLRGKVNNPDAFPSYINVNGKTSEVAPVPEDIEFSKL